MSERLILNQIYSLIDKYEINVSQFPAVLLFAGSFIVAFLITFFSIPTIVKIANFKKLFDIPNERTSHKLEVPVLGGLALFSGFTVSAIIFTLSVNAVTIKFLIGGIIVLFFLGLKDDILVIDPKKKVIGQLTAALILVILGNVRITSFYTILGIADISYPVSVIISVFFILALVNGFNLIDGIDGLASGTGILTSLFFGVWFFLAGNISETIISCSLIGVLLAYFRYNVFGKKNKIFMGDTGSMITGFIVAYLAIQFIETMGFAPENLRFESAPAVAFGLLIVPLFDTLRIIIVRLKKGKSPFKADNNHIHHNLLKLGFSHALTTMIIIFVNLLITIGVIWLQGIGNTLLFLFVLLFGAILSLCIEYLDGIGAKVQKTEKD